MPTDPRVQVRQFVVDNLRAMSTEYVAFQNTGILPDGKIKEAVRMLADGLTVDLAYHNRMRLVESYIFDTLLQQILDGVEAPSPVTPKEPSGFGEYWAACEAKMGPTTNETVRLALKSVAESTWKAATEAEQERQNEMNCRF